MIKDLLVNADVSLPSHQPPSQPPRLESTPLPVELYCNINSPLFALINIHGVTVHFQGNLEPIYFRILLNIPARIGVVSQLNKTIGAVCIFSPSPAFSSGLFHAMYAGCKVFTVCYGLSISVLLRSCGAAPACIF